MTATISGKEQELTDLGSTFVDIIIPTLGEPALDLSLQAIEKCMNVNRIILIGPEHLKLKYKNWSSIDVVVSDANVGCKRSIGVDNVRTKYFACVDSDVIISKEWFDWCIKTISDETVGACEGFGKELGPHISRIRFREFERGKDWLGLGCAMLRTDVVRKVGMPQKAYAEDLELMRRIRGVGYKWICNPYLTVQHLVTDVMYWKHCAKWGERGGSETMTPAQWVRSILGSFTKNLFIYQLSDCLFLFAAQLFLFNGYIKGLINKKIP